MTLTVGSGPLSRRPADRRNFEIRAAEHRLLLEDYPCRLRAIVAGRVVLDSTRASILHETGRQIVPYVPLEDFEQALLRPGDKVTRCPFKGDASYWTVQVDEHAVHDAVLAYEQPPASAAWLAGLAALRWDAADAWFVEDELAFGPHLRDPYHRVDVYEASRPVTVRAGDHVLARTDRSRLVFETSLPVRVYVPRADVLPGILIPSAKRTQCPYKGEATYFSLQADGRRIDDGAWTYQTPLPEAHKVTGDICFMAEGVDVDVGSPKDPALS